jgi:hypothetical protein
MADSGSFETCPTDIVHASSEQVWDVLTDPARLDWVGVKLVESPSHRLAVGDRLVFRPAPGLHLSWTVLAVEPLRTLEAEVSIERGPTIVAAQGRHDDDLVVPDPERHLDVELSRASIPSSGSGRRSCGVDRARRGRARDHHQRPTVRPVESVRRCLVRAPPLRPSCSGREQQGAPRRSRRSRPGRRGGLTSRRPGPPGPPERPLAPHAPRRRARRGAHARHHVRGALREPISGRDVSWAAQHHSGLGAPAGSQAPVGLVRTEERTAGSAMSRRVGAPSSAYAKTQLGLP